MADNSIQKQYNIKFGIEIEMISPIGVSDFIKLFNTTAHKFLLPTRIGDGTDGTWEAKSDSSIRALNKQIGDTNVFPTKIPLEKFPSQKIMSSPPMEIGYRKGEQQFLPMDVEYAGEKEIKEAKMIERHPELKAGEENIAFKQITDTPKIELVSPNKGMPFTDEKINEVRWVIRILKRMRMKVNASTGIHIHMSHNNIDFFNFAKLLMNVDEKKIKQLWPTRFGSYYTKSKEGIVSKVKEHIIELFDEYAKPDKIVSNKQLNNIFGLLSKRFDRYYGINAQAIKQHGTVEFRYAGADFREERVIDWIEYIRELTINSLLQKSIKIGEFEISEDKNGNLSIKSEFHGGEELKSNSIIDEFSAPENRKLGIVEFLKMKGIEGDKLKNGQLAKILVVHGQLPREFKIQNNYKPFDSVITFFEEMLKAEIKTPFDLDDIFTNALSAKEVKYLFKNLVDDKLVSPREAFRIAYNGYLSLRELFTFADACKDPQRVVNKFTPEELTYLFDKAMVDNEEDFITDFLKLVYPEHVGTILRNVKPSNAISYISTFNNLESLKKTFPKIQDALIEDVFSNAKSRGDVYGYAPITFLCSSQSPIALKILKDLVETGGSFNIDQRKMYKIIEQLFLKGIQPTEGVEFLHSKIDNEEGDYKTTADFYFKIMKSNLTYDDVINAMSQSKTDVYNLVRDNNLSSMFENYSVSPAVLFITIAEADDYDFSNYKDKVDDKLKNENTYRECKDYFKRFLKTSTFADKKDGDILTTISRVVKLFGDEFTKQEYYNNINLSNRNSLLTMLARSNDTELETSKKIVNAFLGKEDTRKKTISEIVKIFFNTSKIQTGTISDEIKKYLLELLKKNNDAIDYEQIASVSYKTIMENRTFDEFKKIISGIDYLRDVIDVDKMRGEFRKVAQSEINKLTQGLIEEFVVYGIDNEEENKREYKEVLYLFGMSTLPIIKFILGNHTEDEWKVILNGATDNDELSRMSVGEIFKLAVEKNRSLSRICGIMKKMSEATIFRTAHVVYNIFSKTGQAERTVIKFLEGVYYIKLKGDLPDLDILKKINVIDPDSNLLSNFLDSYITNYSQSDRLVNFFLKNIDKINNDYSLKKAFSENEDFQLIEKLDKGNFLKINYSKKIEKHSTINFFTFYHKNIGKIKVILAEDYNNGYYDMFGTLSIPDIDYIKTHKLPGSRYSANDSSINNLIINYLIDFEKTGLSRTEATLISKFVRYLIDFYYQKDDVNNKNIYSKDRGEEVDLPFKKQRPPENDGVKVESIDYNKEFKQLLLTEGVKKAKLFLMKNKDKITDRKLIAMSKRMGV